MTGRLSVALVVRGKFHYLNYFQSLVEQGLEPHLYYSHKRSTISTLGIDERRVTNFPLTEYLVQLEGRTPLPDRAREALRTAFGRIWAKQVLSAWQPAQVVHFLCHGHSVPVARRALAEGASVVTEVVNSHPDYLNATIHAERQRLGLKERVYVPPSASERMAAEVDAADVVLAPSRHVKRTYVDRGTAADRIAVVPYAANLHRFRPATASRRPGPLRLICVGAISVRKGQLILLEAIKRLAPGRFELTLVGYVEEDIKPLLKAYDGCYRHYPHVPNEKLVDLLHEHDVFVLPTLEEGMAVANCEAMASGLCVLTTLASGAEEVIETGKTGLLVPPGDWEPLATCLDALASDQQTMTAMGIHAAQHVRHHLNWTSYAAKIASLYRQMTNQNG